MDITRDIKPRPQRSKKKRCKEIRRCNKIIKCNCKKETILKRLIENDKYVKWKNSNKHPKLTIKKNSGQIIIKELSSKKLSTNLLDPDPDIVESYPITYL